ncbi:hypothetical protein JVX90_20165 [Gordonia sp. PDNC005]|uniref:hypothetical protein n=1 Tax=unclassified Gordonia (in: high G+C Gram-positive bacteria) TaxID=2657482 RepID=UPI001963587E|nr:hypothetical protein [Gordonia sp. PDNC005]QRY62639.1 hypothetical protein JVX90_20165 [Gordonia sp. PDNC005]
MTSALHSRLPTFRWTPAWTAVTVYLAIRVIGVLVLAWFGGIRDMALRGLLTKWDGTWMLDIAEFGYDGVPATGTDANGIHTATTAYAFFPGYPGLVGLISQVPFVSPFAAGLVVNVLIGVAAAVGISRLGTVCARRMRPQASEAVARRAGLMLVILFAAAPMGIVLSMTYTEALFCALTAWALVGVLEERWLLAGFSALAVGLVRPTGIAVVFVVMLAAVLARHDGTRAWIAGVLAPLGYVGYLCVVWAKTGSPTGWFTIQTSGWDTRFDGGRATGTFLYDNLTGAADFVSIATCLLIIVSLVLLAWSFADRLPWPVLVYAVLVMSSVLLSSGLMQSRARLLLPAFVILLPVAVRLAGASRTAFVSSAIGAALASAWFGAYMLTVFEYAI